MLSKVSSINFKRPKKGAKHKKTIITYKRPLSDL